MKLFFQSKYLHVKNIVLLSIDNNLFVGSIFYNNKADIRKVKLLSLRNIDLSFWIIDI